jgi:tryptophan synthase alpha chain
MGYYNPLLAYGLEAAARDAAQAGVDGFIVVDLPAEEEGPLWEACRPFELALIPLLAPTSTPERISRSCRDARGFIYCVSLTGVTGARSALPPGVMELVAKVRQHSRRPVAVGFGISRPEQVQALAGRADAAVVGSALLEIIEGAPRGRMVQTAQEFVAALAGWTPSLL